MAPTPVTIDVAALYSQHCITAEDGEDLNTRVSDVLDQRLGVQLNFRNVVVFASPFFNAMLGTLLCNHTPEQLNKLLTFSSMTSDGDALLRRVITHSREYFSNLQPEGAGEA